MPAWDIHSKKQNFHSERKNKGALLVNIEKTSSHSTWHLSDLTGRTVSNSDPHNSRKMEADWRMSKRVPWKWSKGGRICPMKKDWRRQVFSPWRRESSGRPHHSSPVLTGCLERGRRISLHTGTRQVAVITVITTNPWDNLPRDVVEFPSMEVFKM